MSLGCVRDFQIMKHLLKLLPLSEMPLSFQVIHILKCLVRLHFLQEAPLSSTLA